MQDWYPGQHVVCIDNTGQNYNGLHKGTVYTIRDVRTDRIMFTYDYSGLIAKFGNEIVVIRLQEIVQTKTRRGILLCDEARDYGFDSSRFRPLKKLKVEDFCNVKENVDA